MKVGFVTLWLAAAWFFLKEKYKIVYFNSKFYNQSLKSKPVSRVYA
jgi:uncharacterized membrane protein YciS (DUF1049 family)